METKVCSKCKVRQPLQDFYKRPERGTWTPWCASCLRERNRKYSKTQRDHRAVRLSRYGLSRVDYDRLLADQGGVCAICGEAETALGNNGQVKPLAVDHDHASGRVRGLLCGGCNGGLGLFKDSEESLKRAINYLRPS